MIETDFMLSSYQYDLPEELIAQAPLERGQSRLLALEKESGRATLTRFAQLGDFLPEPCLFIANNSKVIPARLLGQRPGGGKAEFLLLTPLPLLYKSQIEADAAADHKAGYEHSCLAEGLLKPAKKLPPGTRVTFKEDLSLQVLEHGEFGRCTARLFWRGDLAAALSSNGVMPLPPYIHRPATQKDAENYQTFYASPDKAGSVAAPTAGLHFTPEIKAQLLAQGHQWAELTLYVGYGTFSPVRCADIREHAMHPEYVELSAETARHIADAQQKGLKILSIGTTAARVLEGVAEQTNATAATLAAYTGWINTFIYPGKHLRVVDKMLTNFHLPESTLLMLVSALAGRENILAAYNEAVRERFRFFSYGDAMLIY